MAAPSKLTPSVVISFVEAIASGRSHSEAARRAGIGRTQLYAWIGRGVLGEEPYASFVAEIHLAESTFRETRLASIRRGLAA